MRLIDADKLKQDIDMMCDGFDGIKMLVDEAPTIDTILHIQQLERERDAAVNDLFFAACPEGDFCQICKYHGDECDARKVAEAECWEWRGEQEET